MNMQRSTNHTPLDINTYHVKAGKLDIVNFDFIFISSWDNVNSELRFHVDSFLFPPMIP